METVRKCCSCSRPALPDRSRCQIHTDAMKHKYREKIKPKYEADKAAGICGNFGCKKTAVAGRSLCQEHLDYQKNSTASRRDGYKPRQKELQAGYYQADVAAGLCPQCPKDDKQPAAPGKVLCIKHGMEKSQRLSELLAVDRSAVLDHYGHVCATPGCGQTFREFLHVDHINNDGIAHRKEIGGNSRLFAWLVKNHFPPGFQLLCINCNIEKRDIVKREARDTRRLDPGLDPATLRRMIRDNDAHAARRDNVLEHYGRSCDCCGTTRALQIHHVEGGGNEHRREIGSSRLYPFLIKAGFPEGYCTLCAACNWSLGVYGYCPHQQELHQCPTAPGTPPGS